MPETICSKCGGSGWKVVEKEDVSAAERCDCFVGQRALQVEERANIPPRYGHASFDNFVVPRDNPVVSRRLSASITMVRGFVREFRPDGRGLLLLGDPGAGKTHLAVAALRALIAKGFDGVYFDYQNLLERIQRGWNPEAGASDREAYAMALDAPILLLDDLGARRVKDWVEDTVASIITDRCNNKKTLIATTNIDDPDVSETMMGADKRYKTSLAERIGIRARSRLFEMCRVVDMFGVPDYRMNKTQAV